MDALADHLLPGDLVASARPVPLMRSAFRLEGGCLKSMARQAHFGDEAKTEGFVPREKVEALGREFVGTREIATLAGCTTKSVSWALKRADVAPVMIDVPF